MIRIQTDKDVKIAVYDLNITSKKVIVLIHGWPLSEKIFEYQKEMLLNVGYRVITMDLRGFGNSDVPASGYGYNQMADDIYQVVKTLNLTSFTLVGFSMGGAVVSRYMGRHNGYGVKKLCLLAAAAPCWTQQADFPHGVTKESVDHLIMQASMDRPQFCVNFSKQFLYNKHSEAVIKWFEMIALLASGIGTIQSGFALKDEDVRKDLLKIEIPTGIFHGEKDLVVPFELGLIQQQMIKNSQIFSFDSSGHGIFYDEMDRFNRIFLDFLES